MTPNIDRAARDLFSGGRRTRNVKYYFGVNPCPAEQLADYRNRALVQIAEGHSVENVELDGATLD
jgi:hypothetical protein